MKFQREFLRLAGTMLACRLQVMGGEIDYLGAQPAHDGDLSLSMLGLADYEGEMRMLCREVMRRSDSERLSHMACHGWSVLECEDRALVLSRTSRVVGRGKDFREAIDGAMAGMV